MNNNSVLTADFRADKNLTARSSHGLFELVNRIVRDVGDLSAELRTARDTPGNTIDAHAGDCASMGTTIEQNVRRARALRQLRREIIGEENFSGPSWDILLHLFESHVLHRRDTVGDVCIGTGVPCATALRWLGRLREQGLIQSRDDHLDQRRRFVALSVSGAHMMNRYFSGISPHLLAA